jgi:predicted small lipoprotein YifL
MKTYRALLTMLLAVALLAACGNKGDLVRPEPKGMAPAGAPAA